MGAVLSNAVRVDEYRASRVSAKAILNSEPVQRALREEAGLIRARASTMYGATRYEAKVRPGKKRAHAFVYTADRYAMRSNALHRTLEKAVR